MLRKIRGLYCIQPRPSRVREKVPNRSISTVVRPSAISFIDYLWQCVMDEGLRAEISIDMHARRRESSLSRLYGRLSARRNLSQPNGAARAFLIMRPNFRVTIIKRGTFLFIYFFLHERFTARAALSAVPVLSTPHTRLFLIFWVQNVLNFFRTYSRGSRCSFMKNSKNHNSLL